MGAPMARRLAVAGHEVRAWNRSPGRVPAEVEAAASPAEAVEGAEAFVTMLADGPAVEAVTEHVPPSAGTLWLQMSTVGVAAAERLAALAAERNLTFVDAPVMGSRPQAEAGKLVVLAAAPEDVRARCAPVLDAVARRVVWLDRPGDGSRLKLVLNGWILRSVENLAEAIALARALGLDPRRFFEGIEGMPFDTAYAHAKGALMTAGEFPAAFPLRLARKDLALAVQAAEGVELPACAPRWRSSSARSSSAPATRTAPRSPGSSASGGTGRGKASGSTIHRFCERLRGRALGRVSDPEGG